jgi:hypothetical protein
MQSLNYKDADLVQKFGHIFGQQNIAKLQPNKIWLLFAMTTRAFISLAANT